MRRAEPRPDGPVCPAQACGQDAGFTLIELSVVIAVLSVIMVIFTAGILQMSAIYQGTTALADAQAQAGWPFQRLDSELRYAADLRVQTLPGSGSTDRSLLYLVTGSEVPCHALSLVGDRLLRRRWAPGTPIGPAEVLAAGVTRIDGVEPFAVNGGAPAGASDQDAPAVVSPKEATIAVAVTAGGPVRASRRELRATFVAPNTLRGPNGRSLDDCTS